MTEQQTSTEGDVVEVAIPSSNVYVGTLRLAAASLAARCDLTIDDIEDLRLAVDEACALLLPHAETGSSLTARFELAPGRLAVSAAVDTLDEAEPDRAGFAWTVLGALTDTLDVGQAGSRLTITLVKMRAAANR